MPLAQEVHPALEALRNLPAAQAVQASDVELEAGLYSPLGHAEHASSSVPVTELTRYFPESHAVHVAAALPEYVPEAHVEQAVASSGVAASARCLPGEQLVQLTAAGPEYFPVAQSPHAVASSAVAALSRSFPAAQDVQLLDVEPLYLPSCEFASGFRERVSGEQAGAKREGFFVRANAPRRRCKLWSPRLRRILRGRPSRSCYRTC